MSTLTATIPSLPDASALDGTELIELSQAGVSAKTPIIWQAASSPLPDGIEVGGFGYTSTPHQGKATSVTGAAGGDNTGGDSLGGAVFVKGGDGDVGEDANGTSSGGKATLQGGNAHNANRSLGGNVYLRGGSSRYSYQTGSQSFGGNAYVLGGYSSGYSYDSRGGNVKITAGDVSASAPTQAIGGSVYLRAGTTHGSSGTETPGNIQLTPGAKSGGGHGLIILQNLPTSAPGTSGALWRDAGSSNVVKCVP